MDHPPAAPPAANRDASVGTGLLEQNVAQVQQAALRVRENIHQVIVGKDAEMDLLLVALLCEGHVLIEDVPGVGKTMLAKALARSLGCSFQRIQCAPDLLPSDIRASATSIRRLGSLPFVPARCCRRWC